MKKCLLSFFLLPLSLCFSLNLKEKLTYSEPGTFIVTEQNKTYTLLHLHSVNSEELLIEEVSIPHHLVTAQDWKTWIETGAKGHTSWILYAVDLLKNQVTECYSFVRELHLPTESMNAFLMTLLDLELSLLPDDLRLQTGPTARPGQVGSSKPWGPPMLRDGKKVKGASYEVYSVMWPQDRSELAGKKLILYFDKEHQDFPFPYWIQAREAGLRFKIRVADSGKNLKSPKKFLPKRLPFFIGGMTKKMGKAFLTLNTPSYYHNFKLYAVDLSIHPHQTLSLPSSTKREENEIIFELDISELEKKLTYGHQYLWMAISEEDNVYAEMDDPMIFKP